MAKCERQKQDIYLFKQWHVAPRIDTKNKPNGDYPQKENQLAIYRSLISLINKNKVDTVVAEGCEGEVTIDFPTRFNGWTISDIRRYGFKR